MVEAVSDRQGGYGPTGSLEGVNRCMSGWREAIESGWTKADRGSGAGRGASGGKMA